MRPFLDEETEEQESADAREMASGHLLAILAVGFALLLLDGLVLKHLWQWFIAPAFGVGTPTILICCGLRLCVGFLAQTPSNTERFDARVAAGTFITSLTRTIAVWAIGYAVYLLAAWGA